MSVEVRIGVRQVAREIALESDQSVEEIAQTVTQAESAGGPLVLKDAKGRSIIVPAGALGYVEIGSPEKGRVGFGVG